MKGKSGEWPPRFIVGTAFVFTACLDYSKSVVIAGKEKIYKSLPENPGVYLMKDGNGKILYIGKAGNLRRRVSSYFLRPHDSRVEKLVSEVRKVDYLKTDSALEALILESALIKKHSPPYNIREKDDKSFLYVEITNDEFPRVLLVRGKNVKGQKSKARCYYGPFTSASHIRQALRIIRRIFPYSLHPPKLVLFAAAHKASKSLKPCFDYQIGLCPGTCIGAISRKDYLKNIRNIKLLFQGKKGQILRNLEKEMKAVSKRLEFEKAAKLRGKIFALQHIQDVALIGESELSPLISHLKPEPRLEGYDISNIAGTSAVGSMVVFRGSHSDKKEYRLFKIRTIQKSDDVGMLKEVLRRRFGHREWPLPALILVDGGRGQVNAAKKVLDEFGLDLPVVGIAKGAKRKKNEFIGKIPAAVSEETLIKVRNEAHRFAQSYHRKLRGKTSLRL